jgi:hypothetical protein
LEVETLTFAGWFSSRSWIWTGPKSLSESAVAIL